ncbi:hypothetical protein [Pseudoalteromonas sp. MMG012]|uniref:hypothetical protein n=1 Tax=Pseudoalteromonas sp. MMG012 TaxID=2822686 RepID=UPI001B3A799B|nr:hypothetical protein [Pseudoalteromonas sp. MMG012]MBQ4851022.1 hypothetical protein [Pseudoalteromonas sp. MMG012]
MSDTIVFTELSEEHVVVKAADAMVLAHSKHETMYPAILAVRESFPSLTNDVIMSLWVGINAAWKNDGQHFS